MSDDPWTRLGSRRRGSGAALSAGMALTLLFSLVGGGVASADTTTVTVVVPATAAPPLTAAPPVTATAPATGPATTTGVGAATGQAAVSVTGPQSGDTVVNTALQISGTAPPDLLVSVSIVDTGTARSDIAHQPSGRIAGSVTSAADRSWVFVPQLRVVPGSYEVTASYSTAQNQTIASPAVPFTVVNVSGESAVASTGLKWKVALTLVFLALVTWGGIITYRRRREQLTGSRPAGTRPATAWWQARRERGPGEMQGYVSYTDSQSGSRASKADKGPYPDSQPLFMNTIVGRSFQRDQVKKLHEMDDKVKGVERALAGTAEALELSYSTITALRHQILDELTASEPDPDDDPFTSRRA